MSFIASQVLCRISGPQVREINARTYTFLQTLAYSVAFTGNFQLLYAVSIWAKNAPVYSFFNRGNGAKRVELFCQIASKNAMSKT